MMTNKQALIHDQRLTRFLLSQIRVFRSNFHDIWTDMELENHEPYLEIAANSIEDTERQIKTALNRLDNLQPETIVRNE